MRSALVFNRMEQEEFLTFRRAHSQPHNWDDLASSEASLRLGRAYRRWWFRDDLTTSFVVRARILN